jgi:hypothetical protein
MFKIDVECMEDALMADVRNRCTEKLAGLKCPDHDGEVILKLTNGPGQISVSKC